MTVNEFSKKLKDKVLSYLSYLQNKTPEHLSKHSTKYAIVGLVAVVCLTVFVEPQDKSIPPVEPNNTKTSSALKDPQPTPPVKPNDTNKSDSKQLKGEWPLSWNEFIRRMANSKLLPQVQSFGVILVAIIYLLEKPKRQKQAELQAWQLIDGATGAETSGARFQAIQELYEMGVSLKGLDANGADLIGINLQGANLERASFKNALLQGANLEGANLKNAQLQKAKLQGANLKGANFEGANLEGAELDMLEYTTYNAQNNQPKPDNRSTDLEGAFLRGANLQGAFLIGANLKDAKFYNADLSGADFFRAKLEGSIFKDARLNGTKFGKTNLTLEQVESVKYNKDDRYDWKDAKYDQSFCDKYPLMNLSPDEIGKSTKENDVEKRKIVSHEMLHNIAALLKVMESNNSVSLQDNLIVKDLKTALESLIENEKYHEEFCAIQVAIAKRLKTDFTKVVDRREKIHKLIEETKGKVENVDSRMNDYEKRFHFASQWLESNRETILNSQEVGNYLERYSATMLTGEVLDSQEKLKADIDKCLKKVCASLDTAKKPDYQMTDLKISSPILAEALRVILDQVIPEVMKQSNNLPEDLDANIKYFFNKLIDKL